MKKKKTKNKISLYGLMLVVIIFIAGVLILKISYNATPEKTHTVVLNELGITPTILPLANSEWKEFIYPDPQKRFSFEFPATWQIEKIETREEFPVIVVTYQENNKTYRLSFNSDVIKEYRDSRITSVDEMKEVTGRTVTIKTLYKEGLPFEIIGYFDEVNSQNAIQIITMELPSTSGEKYRGIFYAILSSIKIGMNN